MKNLPILSLIMMISAPCALAGDGAAIYKKNCAACHGNDGTGNTKMGKKKGARDYTDAAVQSSFSDAEGVKAILEGVKDGSKVKMKAYADKVSEAEAKELMAYIRKFKK